MKLSSFVLLAALLSLAACASNDVIEEQEGKKAQIGFSFSVEDGNSDSRALTMDNFDAFYVYGGYRTEDQWGGVNYDNQQIFNGREVSKVSDDYWDYQNHEYWVEGGIYKFYGYSLDNTKSSKAKITTYWNGSRTMYTLALDGYTCDNNNQKDLIYTESNEIVGLASGQNSRVQLVFRHLLSRISFKIVNSTSNPIQVDNFKVCKHYVTSNYGYHQVYVNNKNEVGTGWYSPADWSRSESNSLTIKFGGKTNGTIKKNSSATSDYAYVIPYDYDAISDKQSWNAVWIDFKVTDQKTNVTTSYHSEIWPTWTEGGVQNYNIEIN